MGRFSKQRLSLSKTLWREEQETQFNRRQTLRSVQCKHSMSRGNYIRKLIKIQNNTLVMLMYIKTLLGDNSMFNVQA